MFPFCRAPQQFLLDRARTHGRISLYCLTDEPFATVGDPEIAHAVLHAGMDDFGKGPVTDAVRSVFGNGIFSADDDDWTLQSKAISPMFARHRIRRLTDTITGFADRQIHRWRDRGDHEEDGVLITLKRFAFDVVATAMFSLHDEQERDEIFDGLYQLDRLPLVSLWYLGRRLPLDRLSGIVAQGDSATVARMKLTNERLYAIVDRRLASAEQADDIIGSILASPQAIALPYERRRLLLRDVIASLLAAGYVSTGESMFWTLYHLARHPQAQTRAREEVLAASGPLVDPPPFLSAAISESLRLYPAAWYVGRTARRRVQFDGVEIPAGTQVICSPYVLHRLPALWPNADTFVPERFLSRETIVPRSYMPFATGPRACVGRAMALMEITSVISATLAAFDLELADAPEIVTLTGAYSLQPRERISVRFRPRT